MIKNFLTKSGMVIGALALLAGPAFSNTLSFTFANNTSGISLNSSGNITAYNLTITGITDTSNGAQVYSYTGLNDTISFNTSTDIFSIIAGSASGFGSVGAGTTLLSWTAAQSTGSSTLTTYGAATKVDSVNATFATQSFGSAGIPSAFSDSGLINISGNSNSLSLTATPEPATFLLFGTGLIAASLFARRRRTAKQNI